MNIEKRKSSDGTNYLMLKLNKGDEKAIHIACEGEEVQVNFATYTQPVVVLHSTTAKEFYVMPGWEGVTAKLGDYKTFLMRGIVELEQRSNNRN